MTTTTADVAAADTVTCSACKTSVPKPAGAQRKPLWDAERRWIGTRGLFSCPNCPQVIVVDEQGRHLPGPGVQGHTDPLDGRRGGAAPQR
ncbi:hypothetical protein SUDANB176_07572 (plasmid) [Streptomyces sp. enrichment culture]|uniref:hypothetical protein n=1 Tax=Streptomyces sp. enrichment culture TaxID=1795815 RepID=UPI003F55878E